MEPSARGGQVKGSATMGQLQTEDNMGNTINDVGSWLYGKVWRPVERELFNYQGNVDQFVGNVVRWDPADVNTSDRAAAVLTLFAAASPFGCEQQEESSKPAEDIGQSKDVAPEVSQKPGGIAFCAKSGVVEVEDDCHLDKNIKDKMSSCVYLTDFQTSNNSKLIEGDRGFYGNRGDLS